VGLLGRVEQSSPNAAWRRAEGAGLAGEGADRAIIYVVAMRVVSSQYRLEICGNSATVPSGLDCAELF
jgi:hypothetical protein